jgi:hypothetical protein
MPLDGSVLGNLAAEQMAALEEHYGDEDVQIGTVITIVEVQRRVGTGPQGMPLFESDVRARFNIGDPFHVSGVLSQAQHNLLAGPGYRPESAEGAS